MIFCVTVPRVIQYKSLRHTIKKIKTTLKQNTISRTAKNKTLPRNINRRKQKTIIITKIRSIPNYIKNTGRTTIPSINYD